MTPDSERSELPRAKPETLRLRSITPVLTVADVAASLAWYQDIVGFYVKDVWREEERLTGAEIRAGTQTIVLVQDDWAKGRERAKGEGFRVMLGTAQDIDGIAETIVERGGVLDAPPADMPWGARAFSLVDPDGFKLTISSV